MKRSSPIAVLAAIMAAVICMSAHANALPREEAMDKGLLSDEPYAYALAAKAAGSPEAEALLAEALENAPDTPRFYFLLAKEKLPSLVGSFSLFIEGIKAYGRSFWWRTSLVGLLAVSFLMSLSISLLLAALIRFARELPLVCHDINERRPLIIFPLLILPLSVLGPLMFTAGALFVTSIYAKKSSKAGVYMALLLVMLSPLWGPFLDRCYALSDPVGRAVVAVNEGRDNSLALEVLKGREDFESRFSHALALKREGMHEEAMAIFTGLLETNPDARVYTNLGNAQVMSGQRDLAKASYLKAIEKGRSTETLYNLSQLYREELDFENGDKYFKEAQAMDNMAVSRYAARVSKHPNRIVVDATLTDVEIRRAASWNTAGTVKVFPVGTVVPAAVAGVLLAFFVYADHQFGERAFRCKNCGAAACMACAENAKLCRPCQEKLAEQDDARGRSKVARLLQANKQKESMMGIIRALSFAPPGIAQMYSGRVLAGVLFMWGFLFSIFVLALDPLFSTGLAGGSHGWLKAFALPLMLVLYYISFLTVGRRLDRGWL